MAPRVLVEPNRDKLAATILCNSKVIYWIINWNKSVVTRQITQHSRNLELHNWFASSGPQIVDNYETEKLSADTVGVDSRIEKTNVKWIDEIPNVPTIVPSSPQRHLQFFISLYYPTAKEGNCVGKKPFLRFITIDSLRVQWQELTSMP